ncbi:hypothetical protein [Nocardia amamiensis]|uniref:hypothetical protein n=1 Tax=Nocardia amamiensis TaxID=404578 RepID=UPI0008351E0A|nr:hypothetical protein [Nocardia amamiensis]
MSEADRTGIPRVDELIEVADRERGQFWALAALSDAEATVSAVRGSELAEAQRSARRRWSAAKGRLTRAQKDGNADKIADARKRCDAAYAEFDAISVAVIREMQGIVGAGLERNGEMLGQMRRSWDAGAAVIDALSPPEPGIPRLT